MAKRQVSERSKRIDVRTKMDKPETTGEEAQMSLKVGSNYFIRTVTHYYTGKLIEVGPLFLVLENAAWIADTGRFATALSTGELAEVEPYPEHVFVALGAIVDISPWTHELPRTQK